MSARFGAYFQELDRLSNEELDRGAARLVLVEKQSVAELIAHLAVIAERGAELERSYHSLFEYCVRRLNLSEGSVWLRIQVANVSRRFPAILEALAAARISLSVAGHLAPHLTEENVETLLADCAGMTKREVKEYLVHLAPKEAFNPSIRARPSSRSGEETERAGEEEAAPAGGPPAGGVSGAGPREAAAPERAPGAAAHRAEEAETAAEKSGATGAGAPRGGRRSAGAASTPGLLEPASPDVWNVRFSASKRFRDLFTRFAEVLGYENPVRHMDELLELALDLALEKKDPMRKHARRLERERKRAAAAAAAALGEARPEISAEAEAPPVEPERPGSRAAPAAVPEGGVETEGTRDAAASAERPRPDEDALPQAQAPAGELEPARSRHLPAEREGRAFERAGYQCEFRGPDGVRCTCRTGLQIEHVKPFAIFHSHDERYLRVYCERHNVFSAERVYGREFLRRKIEETQRARDARAAARAVPQRAGGSGRASPAARPSGRSFGAPASRR